MEGGELLKCAEGDMGVEDREGEVVQDRAGAEERSDMARSCVAYELDDADDELQWEVC